MTKIELIKENERLEQELHNKQNEYLMRESDLYFNKLIELDSKINDDLILKFLENCTIVQKQQLEDFISTL